jgi:hypothetical protein
MSGEPGQERVPDQVKGGWTNGYINKLSATLN